MKYEKAYPIARDLAKQLAPYCERIEIAGGVRRKKAEPHDIELVAIAKVEPIYDMFGYEVGERNLLDEALEEMVAAGQLVKGRTQGPRFKQFQVYGVDLDLFIVKHPAQWGVIFAIRTGPAHYSHWLVTQRSKGGPLPDDAHVRDGAVWCGDDINNPLPMDSEDSFFAFLDIPMPAPQDRIPAWGNKQ